MWMCDDDLMKTSRWRDGLVMMVQQLHNEDVTRTWWECDIIRAWQECDKNVIRTRKRSDDDDDVMTAWHLHDKDVTNHRNHSWHLKWVFVTYLCVLVPRAIILPVLFRRCLKVAVIVKSLSAPNNLCSLWSSSEVNCMALFVSGTGRISDVNQVVMWPYIGWTMAWQTSEKLKLVWYSGNATQKTISNTFVKIIPGAMSALMHVSVQLTFIFMHEWLHLHTWVTLCQM